MKSTLQVMTNSRLNDSNVSQQILHIHEEGFITISVQELRDVVSCKRPETALAFRLLVNETMIENLKDNEFYNNQVKKTALEQMQSEMDLLSNNLEKETVQKSGVKTDGVKVGVSWVAVHVTKDSSKAIARGGENYCNHFATNYAINEDKIFLTVTSKSIETQLKLFNEIIYVCKTNLDGTIPSLKELKG